VTTVRRVKPVVFLLLLLPAAWLVIQWALLFMGEPHGLGFNPQEASNRFAGRWALRTLILALAVSPLAELTGRRWLILLRRMTGLFAFFYICLHLTSYLALDLVFDWAALWEDVRDRTYITLGMTAFLLLLPLAVTSTKGWVKRLGARRWQRLHRLVYVAGALAALHFLLLAKGNQLEPKIYAGVISGLLVYRLVRSSRLGKPPRSRPGHQSTVDRPG